MLVLPSSRQWFSVQSGFYFLALPLHFVLSTLGTAIPKPPDLVSQRCADLMVGIRISKIPAVQWSCHVEEPVGEQVDKWRGKCLACGRINRVLF